MSGIAKRITWQQFPIESFDDRLALVFRLHPSESDTPTDTVLVTQNTRRNNLSEVGEHVLQVVFGHVNW